MITNIIIGAVAFIAFVVIIVMIVKKFKKLAQIDTSKIPEEKQAGVKSSLMEQRLERKFKSAGSYMGDKVKPAFGKIASGARKLKDRAVSMEKHYAERAKAKKIPTLEEKEEVRQKVNKLFTEAGEFQKDEKWAEAEKKYLEILGLDLKDTKAYEKLGWVYVEMKDYEHAKETFEFIKKINPKDDELYLGLGEVCWALDKKEEALLNYKEAVNLSPNDPKNLNLLFNTAIELKDKYLAQTTLDKLRQVNPENQKLLEMEEKLAELDK